MLTIDVALEMLPLHQCAFSFLSHTLFLLPNPPPLLPALDPLVCSPTGDCWPTAPPPAWDHGAHRTLGGTAGTWHSACHPAVWPWSPGKGCRTCGCRRALGEHACSGSSAHSTRHTRDLHSAPWHRARERVTKKECVSSVYEWVIQILQGCHQPSKRSR